MLYVYTFFRRARISGPWDTVLNRLVELTRKNPGREPPHPAPMKVIQSHKGFDINAAHKIVAEMSERLGYESSERRKAGSCGKSKIPNRVSRNG